MAFMEWLKHYLDFSIFLILGSMGFLALFFILERIFYFWRVKITNFQDEASLEEHLSSNLNGLYIIYSNSPYIGLLGTILGIMVVFYDTGLAGKIDTKNIVIGLSLALKAKALGILVAIPALVSYQILLACIQKKLSLFRKIQNETQN